MASEVGLAVREVLDPGSLADLRRTRVAVKRMGNQVGTVTRMELRKYYDNPFFPVVVAYRAVGTLKGQA